MEYVLAMLKNDLAGEIRHRDEWKQSVDELRDAVREQEESLHKAELRVDELRRAITILETA